MLPADRPDARHPAGVSIASRLTVDVRIDGFKCPLTAPGDRTGREWFRMLHPDGECLRRVETTRLSAPKPRHVRAIRTSVHHDRCERDPVTFKPAIDGELGGRDLVFLQAVDVLLGGAARLRTSTIQQKTGRPVAYRAEGSDARCLGASASTSPLLTERLAIAGTRSGAGRQAGGDRRSGAATSGLRFDAMDRALPPVP